MALTVLQIKGNHLGCNNQATMQKLKRQILGEENNVANLE